jgi:hypothetical protein
MLKIRDQVMKRQEKRDRKQKALAKQPKAKPLVIVMRERMRLRSLAKAGKDNATGAIELAANDEGAEEVESGDLKFPGHTCVSSFSSRT